ncbi:MAG: hypothetical protein ABIH53_04975 [archaeon]
MTKEDKNIETIIHQGKILAIIAKTSNIENTLFLSPKEFFLQASIQNRTIGEGISAHEHPPYNEDEINPQEIIYVINGKIEVGLYSSGKKIESRQLNQGELILLNSGHDVSYLENSKIILLKTGPYRGKERDKKHIKEV